MTALTMADAAYAQRSDAPQSYSIPSGSLGDALNKLASQSKLQIVYPPDLVRGKTAVAISGEHTWREALQKLLAGSGLEWGFVNDTTVVIKKGSPPPTAKPKTSAAPSTDKPKVSGSEPEPTTLDTMTVTGSRIRGGTTPSPVITVSAEQIQEEGFTDLGEVIRSIPQNFSGGQNPGVTDGATMGNVTNQNVTGGSSLNLRGLGPDASLTLLNGRRLSYGGFNQAVDISAIPVEAVDRIEIVPDGASAIYGSDAVGGVGNVIIKRGFDGVTVGARYGTTADGGLSTHEYSVTTGAVWSSGGLIATHKRSSVDPIYATQRDYTQNMDDPTTIYPGSDLRSTLLSAYQSFADVAELRLDAVRTERDSLSDTGYATYYFRSENQTTTSLVAPSVELSMPGDWTLSVGAAWGKDELMQNGSTETAGASTASTQYCQCNDTRSYEANAEGPVFALSGGDARLAVGIGRRTNDYRDRSPTSAQGGDESSRFAYAELNLPLIAPISDIAGAQRLALTAAVRSEDYSSFGKVTTPKLGIVYDPSSAVTLKASWGKSFKAPTLSQLYSNPQGYLLNAASTFGGTYADDATVLMTYGGNPDLDPERARSWTASLAFHPNALPNLEAELTWFDVDYTDRVVVPVANIAEALRNPIYAEFVDFAPTAERQAEVLAMPTFYNFSGANYDASKVIAILFNQSTNAARQRMKGIDLSASYWFDLGGGRMTVRGSTSWLNSSQQNSAGQSEFDLSGTLFYPAKIKGRLGIVWNQAGFTASAFANYTSGVTNTLAAGTTEKTASFTSVDATARYRTSPSGGAWSGLEFALSAQNLSDRHPPLYSPISAHYAPYDSTNTSAIGRFWNLSVSKHW